ncbi:MULTISPECIES: FAD-binding protein [unclassified Methylophilus]|uniref:FAD-binding protein n=1 Tax=Methylophilus glucosoxydans TaxID=752553 RepID=A0ABW3GH06_9PROT|nr:MULTISPECIES: FAD-binding protein [unclassified Methylophilus]MDF0377463.1 electron transfer flavoprotein subunit alpha/FixB family protein [Methylophilus sp. YYY-1]MDT7849535.1 FAD-binding protein [Methylophilus sp. VKM B-3414]
MRTLIIAEHDGQHLNEQVARAVTAAQHWQQPVDVLIAAAQADGLAAQAAALQGVSTVLVATDAALQHPTAEHLAALVVPLAANYSVVLAAHSAFSKNVMPRIAALLDVNMLSDVLEIVNSNTYVRGIYAGNVLATVQSSDAKQVLTVRGSKFSAAATGANAAIQSVTVPAAPEGSRWLAEAFNKSERPPLAAAKVVVSGGRALGSADAFKDVLAPLADKLHAAIGASRAAVDSGYAPNDLQVGQTGVVVAPELYIAVGISGAIQHAYGMKDSKVVVAINQDPEAQIFKIADYGLVADLFEAVPQLTAAL